jgi:hypothetical protein
LGAASCAAAGTAKAAAKRKTNAIMDVIADTLLGIMSKKED